MVPWLAVAFAGTGLFFGSRGFLLTPVRLYFLPRLLVPTCALLADLIPMADFSKFNAVETNALLERAAQGDRQVLGTLLERDRGRLRRMVALRLDRRLQGRIDPSDVIQEAQLEASDRLDEYLRNPTMPFFLWLRLITGQRLLTLHRRHLEAKRRTVTRELSLNRGPLPQATSAALAAQLLGRLTRPSQAAIRA